MRNVLIIILTFCIALTATFFGYTYIKQKTIKKTLVTINSVLQNAQVKKPTDICAWLPWWDIKNALNEYGAHQNFTTLSPFIYILNPDGIIATKIDAEQIAALHTLENVKLIPTISNDFDPERVSEIINDDERLNAHIKDIVLLVNDNNWDGIDLDYEYLKSSDKDAYTNFVSKLYDELDTNDKLLSVTVHAKTDSEGDWDSAKAQDWPMLAENADYIRIMAYDYHHKGSGPGPIAPLSWLRDITSYARTTIPKEKRILALGFYAYEWIENENAGDRTLVHVNGIIASAKTEVNFDENVKAPFIEFQNAGSTHTIWYEDADSIKEKLNIAKNYSGLCIWKIGGIPGEIYDLLPEPI
jgi:spore germination protein YaaH